MGRWHAEYSSRERGEIAAIVDVRSDAANRLARSFPRAMCFAGLGDCLERCHVDVVHICTDVDSHVSLAEAALHAGKHVLVEKPMARTAAQTQQLVALARNADVKLSCVHQFPFQRGFVELHRDLRRLGELVRISFRMCSTGGEGCTEHQRRERLLDILPHPFSLFHGLLDASLENCAWRLQQFTNDDLEIRAQLDGLVLGIQLSLRGRPTCNELHVVGTQGTAHLDLFHGFCVRQSGRVSRQAKILRPFAYGTRLLWAAGVNLGRRMSRSEPAYPGLRALIGEFYRCISDRGATPESNQQMIQGAYFVDRIRAFNSSSNDALRPPDRSVP